MKILICDDEELMVQLLSRTIAPIASFIDSTPSLEQALSKVEHGSFNIVILDLRLVDSDKEKSLEAIRAFKQFHVAVVVMSGISDPRLKEESIAAGADGFVGKMGDFNSRAILVALNVATLNLPKDSDRSDSYERHVALLQNLCHA